MRDFNKVIIMGNMARDPELKELKGGKQVTSFAVACNRSWTGPEGQEVTEVAFIDCEIWGKQAKTISDHFSKGRPILVEGHLKQDSWVDKDTQKNRSRLLVSVETFNFVDSKKSSEAIPAVAGNSADGGMNNSDFDAL